MEIKKIIDYINRSFIASEYLREPDVNYYMDLVIDDINDRLQAKFPTFTDWKDFVDKWNASIDGSQPIPGVGFTDGLVEDMLIEPRLLKDNTKYDVIPDKYLRSVVALGTAVKFYTRDEEGEQIAMDYQNRYEMALFKMVRDYHNQVPWYFQENTGGYIDFSYNRERGPRDLVPRGVVLRGDNTRIL